MIEIINEKIKIFVFFDGGKIIPIAFSWHGRRYDELKINSHWTMRKGQWLNQHFSLSAGGNIFEVVFDIDKLEWRLVSVDLE